MRAVLLVALAFVAPGCNQRTEVQSYARDQSGHRVVRISFRGQHGSFRIRVNAGPIEKVANTCFTNTIIGFHLEHGDIVIWEAERDAKGKEVSWPPAASSWFSQCLHDARASWYLYSSDWGDVFATPIFHWKAPADNPKPLTNVTFYLDGQCLGQAANGFRKMLETIAVTKPKPLLIFGSRLADVLAEPEMLWAQEAGLQTQFESIEFGRRTHQWDLSRIQ